MFFDFYLTAFTGKVAWGDEVSDLFLFIVFFS